MNKELSEFKKDISNIDEPLNIGEERAMTAYYASLIEVKSSLDAFYFCASINLLNSY